MVLITVKGTTHKDEFIAEYSLETLISNIAPDIAKLLNMRRVLQLQLYSARELSNELKDSANQPDNLNSIIEVITNWLNNASKVIIKEEAEKHISELQNQINILLPLLIEGTIPSENVLGHLYSLYESSDIDENQRVRVYHLKAILDPYQRENEFIDESHAIVWFGTKQLEESKNLGDYFGKCKKTRIIVKINIRYKEYSIQRAPY